MNGESGYNTAIRQVEKCSDALFELRAALEYRETDRIAANIDRRLGKLIETIDRQALKMLAPYDLFARNCLAQKRKRDPRRYFGTANGNTATEPNPPEGQNKTA